ncbi:MAG: amidohydrolase [Chitinophagaceae bacterium]|jgi:predicted amidohydrolase|nr:amidohydrolase [Chitinophagaceae bacterium]
MSTLTISLVQTALHWEDKDRNLAMLEEKIRAITERTEVIILPEMFSTGFSMKPDQLAETMEGKAVAWMKKISAEKRAIVTGSLIIEDNWAYFNRLIWMQPDGKYGYYDKRHLFAYAHEDQHYASGNKRLIASAKGWKINLQVCYDLRFPVWARHQFAATGGPPEYDLLIYVANWPERRNQAWKTLLQARAIENQCFTIGVNRVGKDGNDVYHSGDSMVVNPMGDVLYTKAHDEDVFTITLNKTEVDDVRAKLPFWKDGDKFMILDA